VGEVVAGTGAAASDVELAGEAAAAVGEEIEA